MPLSFLPSSENLARSSRVPFSALLNPVPGCRGLCDSSAKALIWHTSHHPLRLGSPLPGSNPAQERSPFFVWFGEDDFTRLRLFNLRANVAGGMHDCVSRTGNLPACARRGHMTPHPHSLNQRKRKHQHSWERSRATARRHAPTGTLVPMAFLLFWPLQVRQKSH